MTNGKEKFSVSEEEEEEAREVLSKFVLFLISFSKSSVLFCLERKRALEGRWIYLGFQ